MTSTKKRTAAVLTATILTATLTVPAMAIETPTIRVSSYKGNTLEVGERSGLIIGPSGADYTVISGDPDTVAVEQVLTFWVAVAKVEGSVKITVSNSAGECGSMTLTVSSADSASLEVPASGDSTSLIDNMEIRQEMIRLINQTRKANGVSELPVNEALMNAAQHHYGQRLFSGPWKLALYGKIPDKDGDALRCGGTAVPALELLRRTAIAGFFSPGDL